MFWVESSLTHRKNSRAMKDAIGRLFFARREQYALDSLSTALLLHRCLELEQKTVFFSMLCGDVNKECYRLILCPLKISICGFFGSKEIFPLHQTRECKICWGELRSASNQKQFSWLAENVLSCIENSCWIMQIQHFIFDGNDFPMTLLCRAPGLQRCMSSQH